MTTTDTTTPPPTGEIPALETVAALGDDLMARMGDLLTAVSKAVPPGLWAAVTPHDRTESPDLDLWDVQFDGWDVETARTLADHMPWDDKPLHVVLPGVSYDFYTWSGDVLGLRVKVVGAQPLGDVDTAVTA